MRSDQVRFEIVQVDVDHAVEEALGLSLDLGIGPQVAGVLVSEVRDVVAVGRLEIRTGAFVIGEQRAGRADFGAHVADRRPTGRRDRRDARAEVLDDGTGCPPDGQDARDLEDHVLWRGPARELPGQVDTDQPGGPRVERPSDHDVDGVGPTDADRDGAESTGVRRMAIGPDDHSARDGVLLEDDLVDDARARLPEADSVLPRHGTQEVVDLGVDVERLGHVRRGADVGPDEMVAVDRRRDRHPRKARGHELEQRHLGHRVLHHHSVGSVVDVVESPLETDRLDFVGVGEEGLLREGQRPS